jgi:hypothetical protein
MSKKSLARGKVNLASVADYSSLQEKREPGVRRPLFTARFLHNLRERHEKTSMKGLEVLGELKVFYEKLMLLSNTSDYEQHFDVSQEIEKTFKNLYLNSTWLAKEQINYLIGWVVLKARHELILHDKIEALEHVHCTKNQFMSVSRCEWSPNRGRDFEDYFRELAKASNHSRMWLWTFDKKPNAAGVKIILDGIGGIPSDLSNLPAPSFLRKDALFQEAVQNSIEVLDRAKKADGANQIAALDTACLNLLKAFGILENYMLWEDIIRKDFVKKLPEQKLSLSMLIGEINNAENLLKSGESDKAEKIFRQILNSVEPHMKNEIRDIIRLAYAFAATEPKALSESNLA